MCLAIPMLLADRTECEGVAELGGVKRKVSLLLAPEATVGDHVLVHAGYVIAVVDEEEAQITLDLLAEVIESDCSREEKR